MDTTVKNTSIRCDQHPPLSAMMYCDHCKAFLCRICAEVQAGGRVCSTCRKPCRERTIDEFSQLIAQRQKDKDDAVLARAAEARINSQLEKAKFDRDARLKAEFAARKAALAQPSQQTPIPDAPSPALVPTSPASDPFPAHAPMNNPGGTMYTPGKKSVRVETEDPLAHLAERSYLNIIDKAKVIMLLVCVFTMLFAIFEYFMIEDGAREQRITLGEKRDEWEREIKREIARSKDKVEKAKLEKELASDEFSVTGNAVIAAGIFIARMMIGAYVLAALLLLIMRATADTSPRGSTIAAFVVFLVLNLVDMAIFGTGNRAIFILRWGAMVGLYKAMHVGIALHRMRVEKAQAAALAMQA